MIDFETLKFYKLLEELAEKSKTGIIPFSKVKAHTYENGDNNPTFHTYDDNGNLVDYNDCIVYNDNDVFVNKHDDCLYPIISMMIVDENHHDIICTYSDEPDMNMHVIIRSDLTKEEGNTYITISDFDKEYEIIIKNGYWYFSD